jgi:hypothetical protein
MSARLQLEKEIRQAVVFLREKNSTIPSDTIEFMKVAALEKLASISDIDDRIMVLGKPEVVNAFVEQTKKEWDAILYRTPEPNRLIIVGKATPEQRESFWGEIRSNFVDKGLDSDAITYIDAWQTPDDNEEGTVIATVNMRTGETKYIDVRAKKDNYAQEVIAEILRDIASDVLETNSIKAIIRRKELGQDCTEQESAEIKGYLHELKLPEEQSTVAKIQYYFPQEYDEYLTDEEKENN